MGCPHCFESSTPSGNSMDEKTLIAVINFIINHSIGRLMISGGEFTEHPRFKEFIKMIAKMTRTMIFLGSNGMFLLDEQKRKDVHELLEIPNIICLQITNISEYYPRTDFIDLLDLAEWGKKIYLETDVNAIRISKLGRARLNFADIDSKGKPACYNLYALARQLPTLDEIFDYFDSDFLSSNICKPMVSPEGNLFAGESLDCTKFGTVWDVDEMLWTALANGYPCNACDELKNVEQRYIDILDHK